MLTETAVLHGTVIVISYAVEIIGAVPLGRMIAKRSVRIEIRQLLCNLISASWCAVPLLAAGHRIDLIQRPSADAALKYLDVAVIYIGNDVILGLAPEELFIDAADVLGGILITPAEIALLIKVVVVVTYAGHAVKVIDIILYKDLFYSYVIGVAELNELIGRDEFFEYQISAVAFFELCNIFSFALIVSISAVTAGIKVFHELFIRMAECSVLRRKIKVEQDIISFRDAALKAPCELLLLSRITGVTAGNYRI